MIQVNEEAIHSLYLGDVDEACSMLYECLVGTRERLSISTVENASLCLETLPLSAAFGPEDGWKGYDTEHFRLYQFAFTVEEVPFLNERLYAVLTYNLALLYHHQGLISGNVPMLSSAATLYRLCLDLINTRLQKGVGIDEDQDSEDEHGDKQLELATYNNLGHLHSFMGDMQGVVVCRQALLNILSSRRYPYSTTIAFLEQQSSSLSKSQVFPFASMA